MSKQIKEAPFSLEELRRRVHYDANTGVFTWKVKTSKNIVVGAVAGSLDNGKLYRYVRINGKSRAEHRLAWYYVHGQWPTCQIDHINGVRDDNRIVNLRLAPRNNMDNMQNLTSPPRSKSGVRNVRHTRSGRFAVTIRADGVTRYIGTFDTLEDAKLEAEQAKRFYHQFNK